MKETFTQLSHIVEVLFYKLWIFSTPFLTLPDGCSLSGKFLLS